MGTGIKLEDFEILDTIGHGSHGTVRRVKRKSDGQLLVWKELHYASMNEAEKQGLVLEVNLLRKLYHPNIVRFLNHLVDRRTGTLFIFMEYCPGGDLHYLVRKCRKTGSYLEERFVWKVLRQVCEALRACHEKETKEGSIILHRDIKPANVFLDKEGNIKLGDFGLARVLNSDASFARTFVGTPYYMSPEVIDGKEYNEKSDIWSLGCLIYELCSLEPPFKASSQSDLYSKISIGKYKRIPIHYSNTLWEIIQEMLHRIDYLRPSAIFILHNSVLRENTKVTEDGFETSLSDSHSSIGNSKLGAVTGVTSESRASESSDLSSCAETVKERELTEDQKRLEESVMREVECLVQASLERKEKKRQERLDAVKELNVNVLDLPEKQTEPVPDDVDLVSESSTALQEKVKRVFSPPKCVCGGTSMEEWRERVSSVRAAEAAVKEREIHLEEKERELSKKEHRLQSMELEAKQHLMRAQIYLKQCKSKEPNAGAPKVLRERLMSDFDATTVSADIGYEDVTTVAFLDTQAENNPFLKMRENLNKKNRPSSAINANLCRSNTLDNPKSRRKQGNRFYLDVDTDKLKTIEQMKRLSLLDNYDSNKLTVPNIEKKELKDSSKIKTKVLNQVDKDTAIGRSRENLKNADFSNLPNTRPTTNVPKIRTKTNAGTILSTLRQNFTRNNSKRKSTKNSLQNKENVDENGKESNVAVLNRKPLTDVNNKTFLSKGVCVKPERNLHRMKGKSNLKTNLQNVPSHSSVFRLYNAV